MTSDFFLMLPDKPCLCQLLSWPTSKEGGKKFEQIEFTAAICFRIEVFWLAFG
jgi:hypothetical protein